MKAYLFHSDFWCKKFSLSERQIQTAALQNTKDCLKILKYGFSEPVLMKKFNFLSRILSLHGKFSLCLCNLLVIQSTFFIF